MHVQTRESHVAMIQLHAGLEDRTINLIDDDLAQPAEDWMRQRGIAPPSLRLFPWPSARVTTGRWLWLQPASAPERLSFTFAQATFVQEDSRSSWRSIECGADGALVGTC